MPRVLRLDVLQELTTRDEYLATRFTKLSASGHDLTPLVPSEVNEAQSAMPPKPLHLARFKTRLVGVVGILASKSMGFARPVLSPTLLRSRRSCTRERWRQGHTQSPNRGKRTRLGEPRLQEPYISRRHDICIEIDLSRSGKKTRNIVELFDRDGVAANDRSCDWLGL